MRYRYIALIDTQTPRTTGPASAAQVALLREHGMTRFPAADTMALFVSEGTPVRATRAGGALVGRVFPAGGGVAPEALSELPWDEWPPKALLDNYWGDYLLLQPAINPLGSIQVLRDPSGGIGCVFSVQDGQGFITSDISLAMALGLLQKRIDWEFIAHALAYPYRKTRHTGFVGLQELLPGCSLRVDRNPVSTSCEWSPWRFVAGDQRHSEEGAAVEGVRQAVTMAVGTLARTERSILVELSGGLDSAIVAACLRDTQIPLSCCTLVTPVPGADERVYAAQVADTLGVELISETLGFDEAKFRFETPADSVEPRIGMLQHVVDEVMSRVAAAEGTSSCFSGGGGDSVFGFLSSASPAADAFREKGLRAAIAATLDLSTLHNCTFWKAGRLAIRKLTRPTTPWPADRSLLAPALAAIQPEPHPWLDVPGSVLPGDLERIVGLVATQVFRESAPRGLCLPLLSQPAVEACLRVPTWMSILGGRNRSVARTAFAGMLPADLVNRRSKGLFTAYYGAIYQRNKRHIRDFLQQGRLMEQELLDPAALRDFFESSAPPRDTSFMRAFDLCMVENWVRNQD